MGVEALSSVELDVPGSVEVDAPSSVVSSVERSGMSRGHESAAFTRLSIMAISVDDSCRAFLYRSFTAKLTRFLTDL